MTLPEKEYFKLYKLVKKQEKKAAKCGLQQAVKFNRCCQKVAQLVNRAVWLEDAMNVPAERRWTNGFK